ncbi:MAG: hypothetical protein J6A88_08035 [Oscillospiraceae bacterium]|nr:hypothetical protein [Oscillospiraceae bacterium]
MRIEIISGGEASVYSMPESANFAGFTLENSKRLLNINSGFPDSFDNLQVQCTDTAYRLSEKLTLTVHLYTLEGKAQCLSWKPYSNFLFYDLYFGDVHIKVYG